MSNITFEVVSDDLEVCIHEFFYSVSSQPFFNTADRLSAALEIMLVTVRKVFCHFSIQVLLAEDNQSFFRSFRLLPVDIL